MTRKAPRKAVAPRPARDRQGASEARRGTKVVQPARRMTPRRRRNRRALIVLGVVALAIVVIGVVLSQVRSGPSVSRAGSVKISASRQFAIGAIDTYRVVYRVDSYAGGDHVVSTDDLLVRRPFESRLDSRTGAPPGTADSNDTVTAFGAFSSKGGNASKALSTAVGPGLAGSDPRFDTSIADLVNAKAIQAREHRRVLGRECEVVRTGEPIGTGRLLKPTGSDHSDECIDAKGLLLEEVWWYKGHPVRRKIAVQIDEKPTVAADAFAPLGPLTALTDVSQTGQTGSEIIKLTDTSRPPATFFELDAPPPGFTHQGRYLVNTLSPGSQPGLPGPVAQVVSDVYVSGPNVLIIDQGSQQGKESVFSGDADEKLNLPALPGAELVLGVYGNVVRAKPDAVRYVRVLGTMPAKELIDVAGRLKPQPKGELVPAPK